MLHNLTISEALSALHAGEISPKELLGAHLAMIEKHKNLNAFTQVTSEQAMRAAIESEQRYKSGEARLLDGIPIGIKDLFCTEGVESASCSRILQNFIPPYESTVTANLYKNGAIGVGKTNMDEFAMGSANVTSARGNVINPWKRDSEQDVDLVPGGSSGGSAAAVAARLCMGSLGSDTGGSIRQPAAFVGVVGVKPSYGVCSRYGMIAFSSSLDQAGVFARTVEDSAILLQAIAGYDEKDSTSVKREYPNFREKITEDLKGLRIGIPKEYTVPGMPKEIESIWQSGAKWLKEQGAEIVDISLPHTEYALPTYYIIAPAEASSNLARFDGIRYGNRVTKPGMTIDQVYEATRGEGFGAEVKRRIMIGTYVLSAGYYDAYYTHAQKIRRLIKQDFVEAFEKVDVILTPTTPSEAFAIGQKMDDPVAMYLNDVFTVPANLAGLPCMSVPVSFSQENKLPLGLQVIAKHFDEVLMFQVGAALERAANIKNKLNPWR